MALEFGSVIGVGLRGHHETVAIYLHITGMEGEPNLCWGKRRWVPVPVAPPEDP